MGTEQTQDLEFHQYLTPEDQALYDFIWSWAIDITRLPKVDNELLREVAILLLSILSDWESGKAGRRTVDSALQLVVTFGG